MAGTLIRLVSRQRDYINFSKKGLTTNALRLLCSKIPNKLGYSEFEPLHGADESLAPVLFLHGLFMSKECWLNLPRRIADFTQRRVYSLDLRDHGDSEWTNCITLSKQVEDVYHFMDSKSIRRAVLVGHCLGGKTALTVALEKPKLVEMLFVEEMFVGQFPQKIYDRALWFLAMYSQSLASVPVGCEEGEARRHFKDSMSILLEEDDKDMQDNEKKNLEHITFGMGPDGRYSLRTNVEAVKHACLHYETFENEPTGLYSGPAYFIYGDESQYKIGKHKGSIRDFFPASEFIEIDSAGHLAHADSPEIFTKAVLSKLQKT